MVQGLYGGILGAYGNPWKICPSPLMSCLLEGCLDSGKDMTNGGSRYVSVQLGILITKSEDMSVISWLHKGYGYLNYNETGCKSFRDPEGPGL